MMMEPNMKKMVNLGLIQMTCSADIGGNFDKAVGFIKDAAQQGAQIVCTQELFKSQYFCQIEDWRVFDLAEEIDENSPTVLRLSELAAELDIVLIASLFEKRATGIYHNTAVVLDADGRYLASTARCTSPMTHIIMKSFISPRATSDIRSSKPNMQTSAC